MFLFFNCILSVILIDAFGDLKHTSDQTLVYNHRTACKTQRWANCPLCFYLTLTVRLFISTCWGSSTNRLTWGHPVACRESPIRSGAMQALKSLFTFYFPNPQPCTIFLYLLSLLCHLPPLFPGYFLFILFINVCYIAASYISYKLLLIF